MAEKGSDLKKRIRPTAIVLDDSECVIVVKYKVEYVKHHGTDAERVVERKEGVKKINVKALNEYSNIPLLAKDVVNKCKLIKDSKVPLVEQLLYKLRDRSTGTLKGGSTDEDKSLLKPQLNFQQESGASGSNASIDDLDTYLECMYDSVLEKVDATGKVAELAGRTEDLEALLMHEPLIGALSRVLREDGKKSIELSTNILTVFFAISNFSQFHQVVLKNQIGDMTMKLIDLEIQRAEYLEKQEGGSIALLTSKAWKIKESGGMLSEKQERVLNIIYKQDRFFYITFYLLLNISEDVSIEKKIRKRSIVTYLSTMLRRNNVELLILCVTFLKKLSIYKENKEEMVQCGIVEKLSKFVNAKNNSLVIQTLRLLHNLSFDERLREEMARNSLIPQLVGHMKNPEYETQVLGLLYHISIEDKNKSMFSYTDALDIIYERLMSVQDCRSTPELIALAVNLSQNQRNAEVLAQCGRLNEFVRHTLASEDELLMKIVRNISQQEDMDLKLLFKPFISEFVTMVQEPQLTADFALELLGTLGNMVLSEFDYEDLIKERGLIEFLSQHLVPVETEDDMLLETVIFIGTICTEKTSGTILSSGIAMKLLNLLEDKKDEEIVLQTAFALHKLLLFPQTRDELLNKTQVLTYLVDLLNDKSAEVRQTADKALDYIMDVSEEHAPKIRAMKFETFNQEWIQIVAGNSGDQNSYQPSSDLRDSFEYDNAEMADLDDYSHDGDHDPMVDHEEYDHGDYVSNANDAYMFRRGSVVNANLGAYTSWQQ
ncbi:kinesin-associated protein [Chloropicon primus]|uniref:Kinesin-associated protein n=1 Tax=Chloropicon primus TaxID=1764295 RepID=A0A5B8MSC5_9CHLO|nr:kinesin-associated protein [Chloropicon primus]UPR02721.1 kinesin-associated protein [Chloropicon primus]|eukprot:QDZ23509.1 kinesin-associated protein [Chloropicon primus]